MDNIDIEQVVEMEIDIEPAPQELDVEVQLIGPQGYSAYEIYLQHGGTLSETEWLESLKGDTGSQGIQGIQGPEGPEGPEGKQGPQGETGKSGVALGNVQPDDEAINVWIDTTDETMVLNAEGVSF